MYKFKQNLAHIYPMDFLIFSIIGLPRSQKLTTPKATIYYEELLMIACVYGPFSCKRPT